ncbi:hypothetical protein GCM10027265_27560 [Jatrophihabitans fulvus]
MNRTAASSASGFAFPDGCSDIPLETAIKLPNNVYSPDRNTGCAYYRFTLELSSSSGAKLGSAELIATEYWLLSTESLTVTHGIDVMLNYVTGVTKGVFVAMTSGCATGAFCTATLVGESNPVAWASGVNMQRVWQETYFSNSSESGQMYPDPSTSAQLYFGSTEPVNGQAVVPYSGGISPYSAFRCDSNVPASDEDPDPDTSYTQPGCVEPRAAATVVFDAAQNTKVNPVAEHMAAAQRTLSGHPGQPGFKKPLHRITRSVDITRNRTGACADFQPLPPAAKSCDEYPFASTIEGGPGETLSTQAVPLSANNSQGGILSSQYRKLHINDGDAFYVDIRLLTSGPSVMVAGDSISQGLEGDYTWRYRLWQHFAANGVDYNFVGPRSGAHDLYSGLPDAGRYRVQAWDSFHEALWGRQLKDEAGVIAGQVATYRPDVMLVELGVNDLIWLASSPDQTLSYLRQFVANARSSNPDLKFVIGNVMNRTPIDSRPDIPSLISSYDAKLPSVIAELTTARSPVVLADLRSGFDPATDTHDGLHPNGIGEYKIARTFANVLSGAYKIGPSFGAVPASVPDLPMTVPTLKVTPNDKGALLSWSHVYGADGYYVWSSASTGSLSRLPLPIADDHWQVQGLSSGQSVSFAIQARRSDTNVGARSAAITVTVHPKTPTRPTGLTATSCTTCTYATIGWTAASGLDYTVSWVNVTKAPSSLQSKTSTTGTLKITAAKGDLLRVSVSAVNSYGEGPAAGVPAVYAGYGAPSANTLSSATYQTTSTALLRWTASSHATAYYIWQYAGTSGPWQRLPIAQTTLSFTAGLLLGRPWRFRVQAMNGTMAAANSNVVQAS